MDTKFNLNAMADTRNKSYSSKLHINNLKPNRCKLAMREKAEAIDRSTNLKKQKINNNNNKAGTKNLMFSSFQIVNPAFTLRFLHQQKEKVSERT